LNFTGVALALYVFMADSIAVANRGVETIRAVLPEKFNWPLFGVALVLMAAPAAQMFRELLIRSQTGPETDAPAGEFGCTRNP